MSDSIIILAFIVLFALMTCATAAQRLWFGKKYHRAVSVTNLIRDAAFCTSFCLLMLTRCPAIYPLALPISFITFSATSFYLWKLQRNQAQEKKKYFEEND